jgi:hypothetical protein
VFKEPERGRRILKRTFVKFLARKSEDSCLVHGTKSATKNAEIALRYLQLRVSATLLPLTPLEKVDSVIAFPRSRMVFLGLPVLSVLGSCQDDMDAEHTLPGTP